MGAFNFEILWVRHLSPAQGQLMLESMFTAIDVKQAQRIGSSTDRIDVPGVTISENPFPSEIQKEFMRAGMEYVASVNKYVVRGLNYANAEAWQEWFLSFRKAHAAVPEMNNIQCRIMEEPLASEKEGFEDV